MKAVSASMPQGPQLSIVIPLYNEESNVLPLYHALEGVLILMGRSYELLFVDDGSRDGTANTLRQIVAQDPAVRVVRFRKNFGQTAAMRAGIQLARGRIIVTMDGDLQNDPQDIPLLVQRVEQGNDLVVGWRRDRKDPLLSRTLPSRIANWLIGWITGVNVHDSGCSLKAYRSRMIKCVPLYSEMHRFIPAMCSMMRVRMVEVPVRHHPRQSGASKYGLSRIGKVLLDVVAIKMLIAFRDRPLHWFVFLAAPFWLCSLLAGTIAWARFLAGPSLVALMASVLFTYITMHFLFVGLLAELIVRSARTRGLAPRVKIEYVEPQSR